jgi:sec-independent protein translocase protein TatC
MTDQALDPIEPIIDPIDSSSMSLMEHLQELRVRLMWVGGALLVGTLIAMLFTTQIIEYIIAPLGGELPQAIGPTDTIGIFFKVSFAVGAALAMPVIVYQLIAFASPGLYPHEKRALLWTLPGIMLLFLTGAAFAYYLLLPAAIDFLQNFLGTVIRQDWTINLYVGFITRVTFWIGVAFETPLVVAFLARAGLLSGKQLASYWRHAIVIVAVVAAAITPTIDPVNMTIVMAPLAGLYVVSVALAYMLYKPRTPRDFSVEPLVQEPPEPGKKK